MPMGAAPCRTRRQWAGAQAAAPGADSRTPSQSQSHAPSPQSPQPYRLTLWLSARCCHQKGGRKRRFACSHYLHMVQCVNTCSSGCQHNRAASRWGTLVLPLRGLTLVPMCPRKGPRADRHASGPQAPSTRLAWGAAPARAQQPQEAVHHPARLNKLHVATVRDHRLPAVTGRDRPEHLRVVASCMFTQAQSSLSQLGNRPCAARG